MEDEQIVWWWLSFCDVNRPEGDQFLGVAIVDAFNEIMAVSRAWDLGCNPGGEVMLVAIPPLFVPLERYRHKLLSKQEIDEMESISGTY
jgi:hypothetical protein